MKKFALIFVLFVMNFLSAQTIKGILKDSQSKELIPYATIVYLETGDWISSDSLGIFILPKPTKGEVSLKIQSIGYSNLIIVVDRKTLNESIYYLEKSNTSLGEIVLSESNSKLINQNILSVRQLGLNEIKITSTNVLVDLLSSLPGVDNIGTGPSIGKPVIRGLSGNRIVTISQGLKVENQQWGAEHGLGVNASGIDHIEIIKGPSSLLYGADAIGGVLFFVNKAFLTKGKEKWHWSGSGNTNTLGFNSNLNYQVNKGKLKLNVFSSYQNSADYEFPDGGRLLNSRFTEKSLKGSAAVKLGIVNTLFHYSILENQLGLSEGSTPSSSTERIQLLPSQFVRHQMLSIENHALVGDVKYEMTIGASLNNRREFEDSFKGAALDMDLKNISYALKGTFKSKNRYWDYIFGSQGMLQINENHGEERLIPNASKKDLGFFGLAKYSHKKLNVQYGLRTDFRNIESEYFLNEEVNFPSFAENYNSLNYSIGLKYQFENVHLRSNLSSGFRAPNMSELLSNGEHEGSGRFERGDANLKTEEAIQMDLGINYFNEMGEFYIETFYNNVNRYIYLEAQNDFVDDVQIYDYKQADVNLFGGEIGINIKPSGLKNINIKAEFSTVLAQFKSGASLSLIPANKGVANIIIDSPIKSWNAFKKLNLNIVHRMKQERVGLKEFPSKDYTTVSLSSTFNYRFKTQEIAIEFGVQNIFNKSYIDHLSRYKNIGAFSPGRNIFMSVSWDMLEI